MRVLSRSIVVHVDGELGPRFCGPGPVPDHIAELITMPGVWVDDDPAADSTVTELAGSVAGDPGDPDDDGIIERPSNRMGRAKWARYAEDLDLEVTDDMERDDIIAAVTALEAGDAPAGDPGDPDDEADSPAVGDPED